jgi:hypothetical protein
VIRLPATAIYTLTQTRLTKDGDGQEGRYLGPTDASCLLAWHVLARIGHQHLGLRVGGHQLPLVLLSGRRGSILLRAGGAGFRHAIERLGELR